MLTLCTQEKSIRGNICTEVGVPRKWNRCCISGFPVSRAGRNFHKSTKIVVTCNQHEMDDIDIFGNSHFVKTSTEEMADHALRRLISPTNATNFSRTTLSSPSRWGWTNKACLRLERKRRKHRRLSPYAGWIETLGADESECVSTSFQTFRWLTHTRLTGFKEK